MEFSTALTEEESAQFENLKGAIEEGAVVLIRVVIDNEPRACVAALVGQPETVELYPLAVLVEDRHFESMTPPPGAESIEKEGPDGKHPGLRDR